MADSSSKALSHQQNNSAETLIDIDISNFVRAIPGFLKFFEGEFVEGDFD